MSGVPSYRLGFYGDDFTGATDALEVLAFAGLRSVLFMTPPTKAMLSQFPDLEVIGIAGDSRAMSPDEMSAHLPGIFRHLSSLGVPIIHYKVCSTFDSSPQIGNIGQVIALGRSAAGCSYVPIVGGTPPLQRYCVFGNLFARSGIDGEVYRLDRHPIMGVHPITPMNEADLSLHLARQAAELRIEKLTYPFLAGQYGIASEQLSRLKEARPDAILMDAASDSELVTVGRLLDEQARRSAGSLFVIGPSGVEYALTQWWRQARSLPATATEYGFPDPVDRVLAVSGSASRLTAMQIDAAIKSGFADIPLDPEALVDDDRALAEIADVKQRAASLLNEGRSVILHTVRGPDDPRITRMTDTMVRRGHSRDAAKYKGGRELAKRVGRVVSAILQETTSLKRLLLSGGDTSSQVTQVLGIDALEVKARICAGVPLCLARSGRAALDGLEIAFKGGQLGDEHFFKFGWLGSN